MIITLFNEHYSINISSGMIDGPTISFRNRITQITITNANEHDKRLLPVGRERERLEILQFLR